MISIRLMSHHLRKLGDPDATGQLFCLLNDQMIQRQDIACVGKEFAYEDI